MKARALTAPVVTTFAAVTMVGAACSNGGIGNPPPCYATCPSEAPPRTASCSCPIDCSYAGVDYHCYGSPNLPGGWCPVFGPDCPVAPPTEGTPCGVGAFCPYSIPGDPRNLLVASCEQCDWRVVTQPIVCPPDEPDSGSPCIGTGLPDPRAYPSAGPVTIQCEYGGCDTATCSSQTQVWSVAPSRCASDAGASADVDAADAADSSSDSE